MSLFWFLAGTLTTLAAIIALRPWHIRVPHLATLYATPLRAGIAAVAILLATLGLYVLMEPGISPVRRGASNDAADLFALGGTLSAPTAPPRTDATSTAAASAAGSMETAVANLSARLAQGGGAPGDWELLAKSYEFLGQADNASRARAHVLPDAMRPAEQPATPNAARLSEASLQLLKDADRARHDRKIPQALAIYTRLAAAGQMSSQAWADYADVAASLQSGRLAGNPDRYVAHALALDPQNPKALWLKATSEEQAGSYSMAVEDWRQLQSLLAPDSADAKIIAANLADDLARAASPAAGIGSAAESRVGAVVNGEVTLAPQLSGQAAAGETLFIVAKSVDSPGAPVAVIRGTVGDWPLKFSLDDSRSMIAGRTLSAAGRVTIEVRVSKKGQPLPAAGDLQGMSGIITPAAGQLLHIVIDRIIS